VRWVVLQATWPIGRLEASSSLSLPLEEEPELDPPVEEPDELRSDDLEPVLTIPCVATTDEGGKTPPTAAGAWVPRKARGVRGDRVVDEIGDEMESRVGVPAPRAGETSFSTTGEPDEHFLTEESGEALDGRRSFRGGEVAGRVATGEEELDVVITIGAALDGRGGAGVAGMTSTSRNLKIPGGSWGCVCVCVRGALRIRETLHVAVFFFPRL
jgi:hypothetical protein